MGGRTFQAEGTAREKILRWERIWQSSEGVLGSKSLIAEELESTGSLSVDAFQIIVPPSPIYLFDLIASFPSPSLTAGLCLPSTAGYYYLESFTMAVPPA